MTEQTNDAEPPDPAWNRVYKVGKTTAELTKGEKHRRLIRYFAAIVSGAIAIMYFLIGFHGVSVLDGNADQSFGIFAGIAYMFGVVLLLMFDRRVFWFLGATLQVFVIFTYFNLATLRTPDFEVWGILIRIAQVMILVVLAYLATRMPSEQAVVPGKSQS
jgi:hypothetical protein